MLLNLRCLIPIGALLFTATSFAYEADLGVVHQIKDQAFQHSRVMDYLHIIADEIGSRLSGSPGYTRAARLAVKAFKEDGIADAGLESWGIFGRGWDWSRIAVQMKTPQETTLSAYPADWSAATAGPVAGPVIFAPLWDARERPRVTDLEKSAHNLEAYKQKYRGKLKGKIILLEHPVKFKLANEPEPPRYSDDKLAALGKASEPGVNEPLEWPLLRSPIDPAENNRQS